MGKINNAHYNCNLVVSELIKNTLRENGNGKPWELDNGLEEHYISYTFSNGGSYRATATLPTDNSYCCFCANKIKDNVNTELLLDYIASDKKLISNSKYEWAVLYLENIDSSIYGTNKSDSVKLLNELGHYPTYIKKFKGAEIIVFDTHEEVLEFIKTKQEIKVQNLGAFWVGSLERTPELLEELNVKSYNKITNERK